MRLEITEPSNLLSVVMDREITPAQAAEISDLLEARPPVRLREDSGDWQHIPFTNLSKAQAFSDGLTYGDEPQYEVLGIEPDETARYMVVVFKYRD